MLIKGNIPTSEHFVIIPTEGVCSLFDWKDLRKKHMELLLAQIYQMWKRDYWQRQDKQKLEGAHKLVLCCAKFHMGIRISELRLEVY